jgi:hypothetical protein
MKAYYLILLPLTLFLVTLPAIAHSDDETSQSGLTNAVRENQERQSREEAVKTKVEEFRAAAAERRLTILKDLCSKMADHRLRELESLKTKVKNSSLATEEKNEILATIDAKIAAVNEVKSDCEGATTVEALKTLIRDLQTKHRLFHSVLPRLHALRALGRAKAFIGRLTNHVATIQKHIDKAEARGCDVTDEEKALEDYQAAVKEAQDHLAEAKKIIATFKDTEDPGGKRTELKTHMTAMKDALLKARDAHKKIIAGLKECRATTKPSPSPSPTP